MQPHECLEGVVVEHAETGAHGVIIRGGYRPRVQWYQNGRTIRTEEKLLRFVESDEITYRKSQRTKGRLRLSANERLAAIQARDLPKPEANQEPPKIGELAVEKVELTFDGKHRVTVDCSAASASFLRLAAKEQLPIIQAQDYYEYYDLPKPGDIGGD